MIDSEADGQLTEAEFGMFVVTLTVAGNETTRNSITQGMMAFTDFPDQWELFKAQRPKTAADEIIRWASPITAFQRTALVDTELGGVQIKKGQRLVLFYRSANFDEDVFDDPFTFDILRDPNPHLGFGGTGAHYCVGANLARMTIDLMFNAIADHIPDLTPVAAAGAAAVEHDQRHQALAGRIPMTHPPFGLLTAGVQHRDGRRLVDHHPVVVAAVQSQETQPHNTFRGSAGRTASAGLPVADATTAGLRGTHRSLALQVGGQVDRGGLRCGGRASECFSCRLSRLHRSGRSVSLVIVLSLMRPTRAAQQCSVERNLAITLIRGSREIPLDLNQYRYVRMHISTTRYGSSFPSMLVFNRDTRPGAGTLLSSMLFPRVDDGRIVLFHNRWYNPDGAIIPPGTVDDFFLDTCSRAGYEPQFMKKWYKTGTNWEVRPN